MGSLLEEDGVGTHDLAGINCDFLDWNSDKGYEGGGMKNYQFLSGEYGVHDGDISSGKVWRDGEDEDTWIGELGDQIESVDN